MHLQFLAPVPQQGVNGDHNKCTGQTEIQPSSQFLCIEQIDLLSLCGLHAGRGLGVDSGRCLAWQRVHGSQELVCNPPCLSEPAEQGSVDSGWVVTNRMLTGKEQTGNRLGRKQGEDIYKATKMYENKYRSSHMYLSFQMYNILHQR